jgi:hypothetical protein
MLKRNAPDPPLLLQATGAPSFNYEAFGLVASVAATVMLSEISELSVRLVFPRAAWAS